MGKGKLLSDAEIKEIELNLLINIDKMCKENDIKYYLGFGTLLGAIRHRGFIPWDDDIDILMPREEYNKLASIFAGGGGDKYPELKFLSFLTDKNSPYAFGKFCDPKTFCEFIGIKPIQGLGVYVDVFPLDSVPEDEKECRKYFKIMKRLNDLRVMQMQTGYIPAKHPYREPLKRLCYIIAKLYGGKWIPLIDRWSQRYNGCNSKYCSTNMMSPTRLQKIWFEKSISVSFENIEFPAPVGAHEYLTQQYGDYMTPPPIEQQVGHHDFKAYKIK